MNLAYAPLYLYLAGIFRKYMMLMMVVGSRRGPSLEIFEASEEDIEVVSGFSKAFPRNGSCGVRVMIRGTIEFCCM